MTWQESSDAIGAAIQAHAPERDEMDGAVLTGWALVAEWMSPDGDRWLSKMNPPHVTQWQADGMRHQALHGDWPEADG